MSRISFGKLNTQWIFPIIIMAIANIPAQNTLNLDISSAKNTIQKTIYGVLMEDWGRDIYDGIYVGTNSDIPNTNGMRNDIIEGLKEIDIGVLQFPGGCNAETYVWRDGIGNKSSRPGGEMENGMGTDEYFQLCNLVGSAPFIQANCKESTPEEMAAWLNYIHENYPNQLKYLGMGNEPWGGCWTQFGRENPAGYLDSWYDPFNAAIPNVFSGKIIRIAAAGYTDENVCDTRWTETVVQREVGKAEGLSWHFYTTMSWTEGQKGSSFNFGETEYYNILDRAFAMARQAKKVMDIMDKHDPGYTMGLQPDEWGAWYDQIQGMGLSYQQSTIRDAQLTAQHFNFFNNNCKRIRLSQSAQPVNAIHALFLTDRSTTAMVKTPSFYVYKLYVPHHNARMVPSTLICRKVKNLDVLTASASLDSSNKLHISISNIHATDEQSLAITLNGGNYKEITGQIVNGPAINSYNDYNTEETVNLKPFASSNFSMDGNKVNVTMPAHSVVMLELSPQGTGTVNQPIRIQKQCSIKALPGERIVFTHGFLQPTPITVSLFTIDGKTVVPSFRTVTEAGKNSLVWHPEMRSLGNNIFIVRMVAGSVTESQRLALLPKE